MCLFLDGSTNWMMGIKRVGCGRTSRCQWSPRALVPRPTRCQLTWGLPLRVEMTILRSVSSLSSSVPFSSAALRSWDVASDSDSSATRVKARPPAWEEEFWSMAGRVGTWGRKGMRRAS
jgi:hypothetical protein